MITELIIDRKRYIPLFPVEVKPGDIIRSNGPQLYIFRPTNKQWYEFWKDKYTVIEHEFIEVVQYVNRTNTKTN